MLRLQRGIISITSWIILGLGAVVLVEGAGLKYLSYELDKTTAEYNQFKGGVKAAADAQNIQTAKDNLANQKRKERADEEGTRVAARDAAAAKRVRDDIASRRFVPEAGPATGGDKVAHSDREKLNGAIQRFADGAATLVERGGAAESGLNLVKSWALTRPPE